MSKVPELEKQIDELTDSLERVRNERYVLILIVAGSAGAYYSACSLESETSIYYILKKLSRTVITLSGTFS